MENRQPTVLWTADAVHCRGKLQILFQPHGGCVLKLDDELVCEGNNALGLSRYAQAEFGTANVVVGEY